MKKGTTAATTSYNPLDLKIQEIQNEYRQIETELGDFGTAVKAVKNEFVQFNSRVEECCRNTLAIVIESQEYLALCVNVAEQLRLPKLFAQRIRWCGSLLAGNYSTSYQDYVFFRIARKNICIEQLNDSVVIYMLSSETSSPLKNLMFLDSKIVDADVSYKDIQRKIKDYKSQIESIESEVSNSRLVPQKDTSHFRRRSVWHSISAHKLRSMNTSRPALSFKAFEDLQIEDSLQFENFSCIELKPAITREELTSQTVDDAVAQLFLPTESSKPHQSSEAEIENFKSPLLDALDFITNFTLPPLPVPAPKPKEKKKMAPFTVSSLEKPTAKRTESDASQSHIPPSLSAEGVSTFSAASTITPLSNMAPPPFPDPKTSRSSPAMTPLFGGLVTPAPSETPTLPPLPPAASTPVEPPAAIEPAAAVESEVEKLQRRVLEIYKEHNPSKIDGVPKLLEDYKGREDLLVEKLEKKYVKPTIGTESVTPSAGSANPPPASGSLFSTIGAKTSPSTSLFQAPPSRAGTAVTPFSGGGNATNPPSSSLFGSSPINPTAITSVSKTPFANAASTTPSTLFGASLQGSAQNPQGGQQSLFGSTPQQQQQQGPQSLSFSQSKPSSGSLFGGGTSIFASTPSMPSSTPQSSLFATAANKSNIPVTNTFSPAPSVSNLAPQEVLQRVHAIFAKHNPAKISEIPYILEKYKGNELQLIANLEKKYNIASSSTSGSSPFSGGSSGQNIFGQPGSQGQPTLFGQQPQQTQSTPFATPTIGRQFSIPSSGFSSGGMSGAGSLFSGQKSSPAPSLFGNSASTSGGSLFNGMQNSSNPSVFGGGSGFMNKGNQSSVWR